MTEPSHLCPKSLALPQDQTSNPIYTLGVTPTSSLGLVIFISKVCNNTTEVHIWRCGVSQVSPTTLVVKSTLLATEQTESTCLTWYLSLHTSKGNVAPK